MLKLEELPPLLTAAEVAVVIRTSPKCVYELARRGRIPGKVQITKKKVLFRRDRLMKMISEGESSASSLKETA